MDRAADVCDLVIALSFLPHANAQRGGTGNAVRAKLTGMFGGLTAYTRAPAEGLWASGSAVKRDDIVVVEVMVDSLDPKWWEAYRRELEQLFRQEQIVSVPKRTSVSEIRKRASWPWICIPIRSHDERSTFVWPCNVFFPQKAHGRRRGWTGCSDRNGIGKPAPGAYGLHPLQFARHHHKQNAVLCIRRASATATPASQRS
jgi:hypothetical protein